MRRLLVTSALPYVNGDIHIGHLVEHIQTDIFVRFQRLRGHEVLAVCGADTHGTATMLAARRAGVDEAAIIARQVARHVEDLGGFGVVYDRYGSTDSPANRALVTAFWRKLTAVGHVREREVTQLFDAQVGTFLADRFVKGTCPRCGAGDQPGDSCDRCGATYAPTDLKDARSTLSGAVPELRSARHWFVALEGLRPVIAQWVAGEGHLHPDMRRWVERTFLVDGEPLRDWDVSRPAPYFGIEIPDAPGNYFYVWLDAPFGYIAATQEVCAERGDDLRRWWGPGCEIHHNIGKDITYFHALFWPAMLHVGGWPLPTRLHIHGWLTVNGEKMSKSKGTLISARQWREAGLDPAWLRYAFARRLNGTAEDLDLDLAAMADACDSDLVGKVANLASRTARFVPRLAGTYPDDGGLFAAGAAEADAIAAAYERLDTADAIRRIMALADRANEFVERTAPWSLKKDPQRAGELERAVTVALNLFRQIAIYLAPVLPRLAEQAGALLGDPIARFDQAGRPLVGTAIGPFAPLMTRVDRSVLRQVISG